MIAEDVNLTELLNSNLALIRLKHKAGVLPDLEMELKMYDSNILNINWDWHPEDNITDFKREQYPVPDEIVNTSKPESNSP